MKAREFVKSAFNRFGFDITRISKPEHILAGPVRNFIRKYDINIVLDVGAYHGSYCELLRKEAGYLGVIVSIEPCSKSFETLRSRMSGDPNWVGYQFALSDSDGTTELITYGNRGDFNSVLHLRDHAAAAYGVNTSVLCTETVETYKIDTIWRELTQAVGLPRVLLKMDTQGHDAAVLLGAAEHLDSIVGIQSELAALEIYDGMMSMPDAIELYRDLGYFPIGFFPVNTPPVYGITPEFDVLFKRFKRDLSV